MVQRVKLKIPPGLTGELVVEREPNSTDGFLARHPEELPPFHTGKLQPAGPRGVWLLNQGGNPKYAGGDGPLCSDIRLRGTAGNPFHRRR